MGLGDLVGLCVGVSAIIGACFGLWQVGKAAVKAVRRIGRVIDDLLGEDKRPELPEDQRRRGVIELVRVMLPRLDDVAQAQAHQAEQIAQLTLRVAAVEAQLRPNGGSTFRDSVDRAVAAVKASDSEQE